MGIVGIWCKNIKDYIWVGDTIYNGIAAYDVLKIRDEKLICGKSEIYSKADEYKPEKKEIKLDEVCGLMVGSEELPRLLNGIYFKWKRNINQKDLFTPSHTKFKCVLSHKGERYTCDFQCNKEYNSNYFTDEGLIKFKEEVIRCCVLDYYAYEQNQDLEEFAKCFGYEYVSKECIKAFKGCKQAYEGLQRLFTNKEIYSLDKYFCAKGV